MIHWLLNNPWWLATQGVVQNSTLAFWGVAILGYLLHKSCKAHHWCWRPGEHPVKGTAVKVCVRHHTIDGHEHALRRHDRRHDSELLEHGESV